MFKRVFAWIGLVVIALWITATVLIAILPIPNKTAIFTFFMIGCVVFPILMWIVLWGYSAITGKKNVASFRSAEMEETMRKADEIREQENREE